MTRHAGTMAANQGAPRSSRIPNTFPALITNASIFISQIVLLLNGMEWRVIARRNCLVRTASQIQGGQMSSAPANLPIWTFVR